MATYYCGKCKCNCNCSCNCSCSSNKHPNGCYDKSDKCLKSLKKSAHAYYSDSQTNMYFDEAYKHLCYALDNYEAGLSSRQDDYDLLKNAGDSIDCLEKYNKYKFNCPKCKKYKNMAVSQTYELDELENSSYYYAKKACDNLSKARCINNQIDQLGLKYIDCAMCGRHPNCIEVDDEWAPALSQLPLGAIRTIPATGTLGFPGEQELEEQLQAAQPRTFPDGLGIF